MENKESKPTMNYYKTDPEEKEIDYSDHPSEYIRNLFRDEKQTLEDIETHKKKVCLKCQEPIDQILTRLNQLIDKIEKRQHSNPEYVFFDNQEFCQIMNISKRTAQNWRKSGKIKFSAVCKKYYYTLFDILLFIKLHSK